MPLSDKGESALRVFYMAHRFMNEFGIRWLPVNPEDIIDQRTNWHLKYVHQIAYETGETEEHILNHVMRSQDGLSMYDVKRDSYDIIINAADGIPEGRCPSHSRASSDNRSERAAHPHGSAVPHYLPHQ